MAAEERAAKEARTESTRRIADLAFERKDMEAILADPTLAADHQWATDRLAEIQHEVDGFNQAITDAAAEIDRQILEQ